MLYKTNDFCSIDRGRQGKLCFQLKSDQGKSVQHDLHACAEQGRPRGQESLRCVTATRDFETLDWTQAHGVEWF